MISGVRVPPARTGKVPIPQDVQVIEFPTLSDWSEFEQLSN